jgi:hypothetical protein
VEVPRRGVEGTEVGDGQQRRELGGRDVDEGILMPSQKHSLVLGKASS